MEEYLTQENIKESKRIFSRVKEIFKKEGEEIDDDGVAELRLEVKSAPKVEFPIIIFNLALLKDLIDILDLTIVGIIISKIFSFIVFVVLFIWTFNKMNGWFFKKRFISVMWRSRIWARFLTMIGLEFIPILGILPLNTILVLMTYYREKKMVKLFNLALEEIHNLEKKGKLRIVSGEDSSDSEE